MALSPDGRTLASGGWDGTILLWDVSGTRRPAELTLSDVELPGLWQALGDEDARTAQDAVWRLAAVPERSVPWLAGRVRPVPPPAAGRLERLIADLDSGEFPVRERASRELAGLRTPALPALRRALAGRPSAEAARRIREILGRWDSRLSPEEWRVVRAVRVLEQAATPEARRHLEALAGGADDAAGTAEARAALRHLNGR